MAVNTRQWWAVPLVAVLWSLSGYALIGNSKAIIARETGGTATFDIGTDAPEITQKDTDQNGAYAGLSDENLWPIVLQLAMDKWNAVPGTSMRLARKTNAAAAADSTDGVHTIVVSPSLPFSVAASAVPHLSTDRKTISDCDVQVGEGPTPLDDLLITVTHELGHCLGLGHNHVDYKSLMGYSAVNRHFRLGLDDMAGLLFLYPAEDATKTKASSFAPCGSIAGGAAQEANAVAALALFFPLLVMCIFERMRRARRGQCVGGSSST